MKQIAKELGAGFAVEGGVRKGGNRVRITAQPKNVPAKASLVAIVERFGVVGSNAQRFAAVSTVPVAQTGDFGHATADYD